MRLKRSSALGCATVLAVGLLSTDLHAAPRKQRAPSKPDNAVAELRRLVESQSVQIAEQRRQLEEQQTQLAAQRETTDALQKRLAALQQQLAPLPATAMPHQAPPPAAKPPVPVVQAQPAPAAPPQVQPPKAASPAAAAPATQSQPRQQPQVAVADQPGVLTPRGRLVLEPSLQYAYSSNNRVALIGYTIIPALTIGLIDVRTVTRNTTTAAITARYGLTNRMEVEAKVPYVYRHDSTISRPINTGGATDVLFEASGKGIGDVEFAGRYQVNDGGADKPYYVANLRVKTRTGKSPFEVPTEIVPGFPDAPFESELPTGSGFWAIQPGLTVIYPSDPAVFFGTVNYLWNIKRSLGVKFGDVDPGDAIGFNFGMGLALNEKSSFSIGYDHSIVGKTKQNGVYTKNSITTQLGTLVLGYSHRLNDRSTLNVSLGAGLTRDAPDVQLTVRMPTSFLK